MTTVDGWATSWGENPPANWDAVISGVGGGNFRISNRHLEGSNLLFKDGHVKWRRRDSLTYRMFVIEQG